MRADWRKAPRALLDAPPLLAGTAVAALLVTFAASAALLFSTAAGSAAFRDAVQEFSPMSAGLHFTRTIDTRFEPVAGREARARAVADAVGAGGVGRVRTSLLSDPASLQSGSRAMDVRLLARDGAKAHVEKLRGDGDGLWIADSVAEYLRLEPGDTVVARVPELTDARVRLRIGAVYRALWKDVTNDDWTNFSRLIYAAVPDPVLPPTFALTTPRELLRVLDRLSLTALEERFELPVDVQGMTLEQGRALSRRFDRASAELTESGAPLNARFGCNRGEAFHQTRCSVSTSLAAAVHLADTTSSAVAAPSRLLGGVGLLIALGVAAAVGVFLVSRRRAEARHRFARGEAAAVFAARMGVETGPVLLAGGAAGFALMLLLVHLVEPSAALDGRSLWTAAAAAAVALAAGALLLVGTATAGFLRQFETEPRGLGRLRLVPWEPVAVGVGLYLLLTIHSTGNHPSLAVFVVPLLLLAGVTGLVLRVARRALRRANGGGIALHLAVRRTAAGPALLVALTILAAVSLGTLFYGRALSVSLEHGTTAKAHIAIGGDVQGRVDPGGPVPKLAFPTTVVEVAYGGVNLGDVAGEQADLMAVDPPTLRGAMHWDDAWGSFPDVERLAEPRGGRLPVVLVRGAAPVDAIWVAGERVPVEVVGRVNAFPGMSTLHSLLVTSRSALVEVAGHGQYDPLESSFAFVWARGPVEAVERALSATSLRPAYFVSTDDVLGDRDVAAARRTYSFLTGLGVAVASLALVGVALYLYARQRSQAVASALARRMGLERKVEVASLWLELSVVLLVAAALAAVVGLAAAAPLVRRTDPLPQYAPAPSFQIPWSVVGATFAALLVVALAAAVATSAAARRTNVAEELRLV
jgi:putative ABC transport system permease protein